MPEPAALLSELITRIAALQSTGDAHYLPGLFPSQRLQKSLRYRREDSNVFFTAAIVYTLQELSLHLPPAAQEQAAAIVARGRATYPHYRCPNGQPTYNYYQTQPRQHFPHGYLLGRFRQFATPDDVDSTSLVYLSDPSPEHDAAWLHAKLQAHANTVIGWATTGPKDFRRRKIYSTWFGKYMPIEFDVSTLSNGMLWHRRNNLPFNEFDLDSLALIDWVISSGEYRRDPLGVSPYYATVPLIAYHAGRLAAEAPQLAAARAALLRDLPELLAASPHFMDKLLLASTLLRLGAPAPALLGPTPTLAEVEPRTRGLAFCIAPLLNYYPHTRWLARWRLSHIAWECPAYSLALVAEYLVLGGS
ncbi:hypothetical protein GCM10023172_12690 [Hymenobacter ginsengisoli]|uniref:Uncharacterized protein n=1 Tax=Hymenobacter ginsengisoli TaxID=1051626 RepID=A0ABP8Q5Z1_9BACT|nr:MULTISPECIES: hypothetical protein [unclassified Hymenobacter]MBO2031856.1 hypothetical protein [Hymenobacter sp. BT559]